MFIYLSLTGMKSLLAAVFRLIFKIPFAKPYFYAFHKKVFAPLKLFKDVVKQVKFKENITLELYIDDWIQENIYFTGTYEEAELKYIKSSLKKGSVFIDIGANIGVHSLFASKIVGKNGKVISFEPFTKNYQSFLKNIALNNISNITDNNLAVSNTDGYIDIYYDKKEANLGMASSYITEYSDAEKVKAVALDSYFEAHPIDKIDFIKIDIEGGEYKALQGMKKILKKYSPKLLIEILDESESNQPKNKENCVEFLKNIGYKRFYISDKGKLSNSEKNNTRMNYVFIKN